MKSIVVTQTPLRISFFGGNTDFPDFYKRYGGCVLSTTINKYIYCIVTKKWDEKVSLNYFEKEIVDSVEQVKHNLAREAMKKVGIVNGIEVTFLSDVPSSGSGLGSSGSLLVGLLHALYIYKGITPSPEKLAREAIEIELDILKQPVGIQDQYIAAYGGLRFLEFQKSGKVAARPVNLGKEAFEKLNNSMMLFYTGQCRKSGEILDGLTDNMKNNVKDKIDKILELKKLTKKGHKAILEGEVKEIGYLLRKNWEIKRGLSKKISNNTIDSIYKKALRSGALGGKISGAGGGGYLLLIAQKGKKQVIRRALSKYREAPVRLERSGSRLILEMP